VDLLGYPGRVGHKMRRVTASSVAMIYFNVVKTEQLEIDTETETQGHKTETETPGCKTETETETQGLKTESETLKFES